MADQNFENLAMGEEKSLGMAGWIAKTFIHSPLAPLLLIASLAIGILGLMITPRQEDPQILVPVVDIFYKFPGASSSQVASLATDPLERMMSEIPGVKHVYSASRRGSGMVTVQFKVGEETENSLVKLYDKLMSNQDKIPPGVSQPLVKPKGADDVPAVTLTLWSEEVDDASLRLVALEVMQRLKEVPNTAQSFITGGRREQMRIEVLPERLRSFGISTDQLANTIRGANEMRKVGGTEEGGNFYDVYSGRFLRNASDLESLIVGVSDGSPIFVRDVAKVIEGPGEANSIVQYYTGPAAEEHAVLTNGAPAVTVALAKKTGTNGVDVANAILAKVDSLKGQIIPDNIHVEVTRNYGETANDKVNELILEMLGATGAVTILIFLFLGLRPTIVVVVVIPVIILVTIFSAWALDYTIDRVSLFALIFSIGILVDDATVVVENVYRRWLAKGRVDTATTIDAVREVGNPTILATLAIIAALLPMGFVSGMMGPYMRPIPVLGSVAMIFSLFAAFMFTPWLVMRVRPSLAKLRDMQESEHRSAEKLDGIVRKVLGPLLDSARKARIFKFVIWGLLLLACSMFYFTIVPVKMLPLDNKPEFNVVINMPEGTALTATANAAQIMSEKLLTLPEVTAIQSYVGTSSPFNFNGLVRHYYLRQFPWQGDIQIQLLDKSDRDRSSHEIAVEAREILTPLITELGGRVEVVEMPPGPPVLQTMVAEIYGSDDETRRQVAQDMTKLFEKSDKIVDVGNYIEKTHYDWSFEVDQDKAEFRNVSTSDLNRQLSMVMGGYSLGNVKIGHELEPRDIIIQAPLQMRGQISLLGEVPIKTRDGKLVPLADLGSFVRKEADPVFYHKDLRAVEYVTGEVSGRLAAPVYGMIDVGKLLEDYVTPDGVTLSGEMMGAPENSFKSGFEWTGEWTVTYETFRDMGIAFMGALILIYMLIVLEFGNFRMPGIIMAPIPLTLIGIIPGHWLLGAEFTATSMIGWIALAGIIVRNSILLVDFSRQAVLEGMDQREAVIQAVRTRTRPILITQLTMIAGSISIIADPIFQGMAISLLFGAIVATGLTLLVIPLACFQAPHAYRTSGGDTPMPAMAASGAASGNTANKPKAAKRSLKQRANSTWDGLKLGGSLVASMPVFAWGATKEMFNSLKKRFGFGTTEPAYAGAMGTAGKSKKKRKAGKKLGQTSLKTAGETDDAYRTRAEAVNRTLGIADALPIDDNAKSQTTGKPSKAKKDKKKMSKKAKGKNKDKKKSKEASELKRKKKLLAKKKLAQKKKAKKKDTKKSLAKKLLKKKKIAAKKKDSKKSKSKKAAKKSNAKSKISKKATIQKSPKLKKVKKAKLSKKGKGKSAEKRLNKAVNEIQQMANPSDASGENDLKRIRGIGPKLERALKAAGITSYAQVAKLKLADLGDDPSAITQNRGIISRALRDGWMKQATQLAQGKVTGFAARVDAGRVPSSASKIRGSSNAGKKSND